MIVDTQIHSKPQVIFKKLINGECNQISQSHKNKRLFKKLGIRSWSIKTLYLNKIIIDLKEI